VATSRFCPFCGTANEPEYAFCHRCGKALPPAAATAAGAASLAPPPPPDEPGDDGPFERPLTDAERSALKTGRRARQGNMARVFGTLTGIVPLFLIAMGMLGSPFLPLNFTVIVIVSSILAVILGGLSLELRLPLLVAQKSGTATEVRGVPEKRPGAAGTVSVSLGGLEFAMKARTSDRLADGRMNAIAFVVAGLGRGAQAGRAKAAVLAVNGEPISPETAYLAVPPEVAKALAPVARAKPALGR